MKPDTANRALSVSASSTVRLLALFLIHCLIGIFSPVYADSFFKYKGEARKEGELVYVEDHYLVFDDSRNLKSAETRYLSPDNTLIATLKSDFLSSLTSPNHVLYNHLTGNVQGLRREGSYLVLFSKNKNEEERVRRLENDQDAKTVMGCQGLNYYLLENLDNMEQRGNLPVRFLMPGKLDSYDFNIVYLRRNPGGLIDFEITIDSWFLKLFAPKLTVQYDEINKRIVRYEGLSNIPAKNGKLQSVLINYYYQ